MTREALDLCAAYGDRHREAALHNNLADLHDAAGRTEESMVHLKQADRAEALEAVGLAEQDSHAERRLVFICIATAALRGFSDRAFGHHRSVA